MIVVVESWDLEFVVRCGVCVSVCGGYVVVLYEIGSSDFQRFEECFCIVCVCVCLFVCLYCVHGQVVDPFLLLSMLLV